ncbi:MAG TPA: XdhC family protein [Castellaniella sp.]|uniref:XdhC family protein n=1 Tax=Castellaniella sp. TaxID=1955812 RepID=UPI002F256BCF
MENLDVVVLRALRDWRLNDKRALFVTVVHTWGSSPRPVGSVMALCEDGRIVGSVSGGCIEDDLIYRNATPGGSLLIPDRAPEFIRYGVTADEAHRFGLPCGGSLELLIEYNPDGSALGQLVDALEGGKLMSRTVRLRDGHIHLAEAQIPAALTQDADTIVNTFGPEYRMLIIGAGQMTECLATMALFSGFSVIVCDPREGYARNWAVPNTTLLTSMPDDAVVAIKPDRRTCVIALTHDPKLDDLALLEALNTDCFYVGAIGSRRNNEARRTRMIEYLDQSAETVSHLRGPIGLYIGSKTPPEIAVSIMAEIIALKNGVILAETASVTGAKDKLSHAG